MDFQSAMQAHRDWIARLRALVSGSSTEQIDTAKLGRDDVCPLGKWLHGEGQASYGQDPTFSELIAAHAEFHQVAASLAAKHANGETISHAELEIPSLPLRRTSRDVERLLLDLRDRYNLQSVAL
jgi:hypothetical protein